MNVRSGRYPPVVLAAMLGLALSVGTLAVRTVPAMPPASDAMLQAATLMAKAIVVIRDARRARGLPIDPVTDPNRTGMIGRAWSPVTTTLGSIAAKRTTTNPNLAAGLVRWLWDAGVREGSVVAIGASGSFPGLIIGVVAAARALGAEPVTISSVAASSWGANDPSFGWLDMEAALVRAGLTPRSMAASLGGDGDVGAGLDDEARAQLVAAIARAGVPLLQGRTLHDQVTARMATYDREATGRPIAVFVNIGGAVANIGTCIEILQVRPGLHHALPPCRGAPGVLWLMNTRGVPVLHLLHADGIARAFGLPIDPVPLPRPGHGAPFVRPSRITSFGLLALYLAGIAGLVSWGRATRGRLHHAEP